jgi:hypothetical protein
MRKAKNRGIGRVAADFLLNLIAYNLIRIPKLMTARAPDSVSPGSIPIKLEAVSPRRMGGRSLEISQYDGLYLGGCRIERPSGAPTSAAHSPPTR